jgi:PKD repeat protein
VKSRHVLTAAAFLPVLALSAPARAQAPHRTFTAFGPQTFQRAAGPPDTFSRSFAVRNPNTTFTLRVHNDRVSSATITLNGVDVVRPSDFNRTVTLIERPVSLQATNQLLVTLRSAPGSSLTIDILGVDDDLPQITAALTPRPNAGGWNNADVTVSFSCGDLTSGIASCPSPSVVSQEGAGQTVGGRAVDLAGNVATTRVVVNLDKTAPIVRMSSPVDQSTVRFPALTASATIADTLSGLATATCNGRPVAVAGGTLSCNLTLVSGPNTIVVEAADLAGNVGRSSVGVTFVPNHPPIANAGGPYSGEEGLPTAFDGSQSTDADSDALTFAWDFGDGTTGSGPAPSHLYATTGTFNVTLTVSDDFGGSATASTMATVVSSRPRITGFTPTSAPPGGLVTVSGSNFISAANAGPQVTLARQGGGTIAAPLVSFTSTSIVFIVPAGAATGAIRVTVEGRDGASPDTFAVAASTTFSLRALPASANVIRGQSVNYALTLNTPNGFSQLAALAVSGLPAGLAASIAPQNISVGQTSVLTISTQIGQPTGPSTFSVTASALVEGVSVADTATLTVNVQPVTTTFLGRAVVDDAVQTPLAGVTVSMLGRDGTGRSTGCVGQTISDAAGNFALTNLASNCAGSQLIRYNGLTATSPPGLYAGVDLAYTIAANQVTVSQVLIHLPRLDAGETVMVQQNAAFDQVFAFKTIPNLSVRIYAGTTFTLVDGTRPNPFPLMAIEVPIDRLPDEMPPMPDAIGAFIVAFQPANTKASQPVAVTFPNRLQTLPGTSVELTTLDPTKGVMVMYGTGVVSNDAL